MSSGVYRIPVAVLLERELIAQTGLSLAQWADERGIPLEIVLRALDGGRDEVVLDELASTLGISVSSIRDLVASFDIDPAA